MAEPCKECPYEAIISELQRDSDRNSEQHREFYKKFNDSEIAQALLDERYTNLLSLITKVDQSVQKIDNALTELKEKPGKKWDNAVNYIITAVIGAVIGAIASGIF